MKQLNILNAYQINTVQYLLVLFQVKTNTIPRTFTQLVSMIHHIYSTRFLKADLKYVLNQRVTCSVIGFRGRTIWNKLPTESHVFKTKIKEKIQNFSNEFLFF